MSDKHLHKSAASLASEVIDQWGLPPYARCELVAWSRGLWQFITPLRIKRAARAAKTSAKTVRESLLAMHYATDVEKRHLRSGETPLGTVLARIMWERRGQDLGVPDVA